MALIMSVSIAFIVYSVSEMLLNALFSKKITIIRRLVETEKLDQLNADRTSVENSSVLKRIMDSLVDRILEVIELLVPRNQNALDNIEAQLKQGGIRMSPTRYSSLALFRVLFSGVIGFLLGMISSPLWSQRFLYLLIGFFSGYVLTRFSLKSKITKRKEDIYHQLPEVMDLLSVSVAAGLGFDQAVAYVVDKGEGPLIEELAIVRNEMALGRTRKESLEAFANRCDNAEIRTFVTAVLQSDEMGSSMQNVLQIQAETIRETHRQNVEEKAQKLPIKMLIPLVLFIFPTIFIVLLGPAIISLVETFG